MAAIPGLLFAERPRDLTGYPVTCAAAGCTGRSAGTGTGTGCRETEALKLYNNGLKSVVSGVGNFGYFFFESLQLDGSFVMAHCVLVGAC